MESLVIALPKSFSHLSYSPTHRRFSVECRIQTYDHCKEVNPRAGHPPLIICLPESDYTEWVTNLDEDVYTHVGILLIEDNESPAMHLSEDQRVLGWIEKDITQKRWNYAIAQAFQSFRKNTQLRNLQNRVEYQRFELNRLNEIGVALSAEKDLTSLLDLIVAKAMELTHADGGSLYLVEKVHGQEEDSGDYFSNKRFRFAVALNESRHVEFQSFLLDFSKKSIYGHVALTGKSLLIDDVYFIPEDSEYSWGGREFDKKINYRTRSMLTVPMFNREDTIIGVIQLINCKKDPGKKLDEPHRILAQVVSFTEQHARATESIASQAAVAIQNTRLLESIQNLFDGFINASVKAIESRDPTTSGHSSRVATLTVALAEAVSHKKDGKYKEVFFSEDQLQEIRYASLLHDFGKIGVREEVLVKAKKLYPAEQQMVMDRFRIIRQALQINTTQQQLEYFLERSREEAMEYLAMSNHELKAQLEEVDNFLKFIIRSNEPTVLAQGGFEKLQEIGQKYFINSNNLQVPFLSDSEVRSLSVPKGSLNQQDRDEIESHVTHTYKFLSIIPWTKNLSNVAEIAYAHHEKLNGKGYPRRLKDEEIPLQSKLMTIADIYDALTALDRPYKKSIPVPRALNILGFEAKDTHIDKDLLDIFINAKIYRLVSRPESNTWKP